MSIRFGILQQLQESLSRPYFDQVETIYNTDDISWISSNTISYLDVYNNILYFVNNTVSTISYGNINLNTGIITRNSTTANWSVLSISSQSIFKYTDGKYYAIFFPRHDSVGYKINITDMTYNTIGFTNISGYYLTGTDKYSSCVYINGTVWGCNRRVCYLSYYDWVTNKIIITNTQAQSIKDKFALGYITNGETIVMTPYQLTNAYVYNTSTSIGSNVSSGYFRINNYNTSLSGMRFDDVDNIKRVYFKYSYDNKLMYYDFENNTFYQSTINSTNYSYYLSYSNKIVGLNPSNCNWSKWNYDYNVTGSGTLSVTSGTYPGNCFNNAPKDKCYHMGIRYDNFNDRLTIINFDLL